MQICKQIFDLLIAHHTPETFHLAAPVFHNLSDTFVISRQAAHRQVLLFEDTLQRRPLLPPRRVRLVTAIAIVVIKLSPRDLLRVEAKFSVGFPTLNLAPHKRQYAHEHHGAPKARREGEGEAMNERHNRWTSRHFARRPSKVG